MKRFLTVAMSLLFVLYLCIRHGLFADSHVSSIMQIAGPKAQIEKADLSVNNHSQTTLPVAEPSVGRRTPSSLHSQADTRGDMTVDIEGAIVHPGVYSLRPNSRVNDVVLKAGGLRSDAVAKDVNRAARIRDGELILAASGADVQTVCRPLHRLIHPQSHALKQTKKHRRHHKHHPASSDDSSVGDMTQQSVDEAPALSVK